MQYRIRNTRPNGELVVQFRYWEDGKLKTVPTKAVLKKFKAENEIIQYLPYLEAIYDHQKLEKARRESWHDKYYDFVGLKDQYESYAKEKAPNSYKAKIGYLENYVFHYFLNEKMAVNLDAWYLLFMDFRQWLKNVETFKNKDKRLEPNTINHCIIELNIFLEFMSKLGVCKVQPRCETFLDAKENSRKGIENVFENDEADKAYEFLKLKKEILADGFWLLLKSGMRINEFRGIGPANIKLGLIPQESLHKLIISSGFPEYKSFIFFNSQVASKSTLRNDEPIKFKPLKSKKNILPEHTRYVPIFDARSISIIQKYMKMAKIQISNNERGPDITQYPFFFDEVSSTILNLTLAEFYKEKENLKYSKKTCHDCRHTYSTWLGEFDITKTLQEYICGHQKESAERYSHLNEKLAEKLKLTDKNDIFDGWE